MTIELPSRAVRDYLAQFGIAAVYVTSGGKLGAGRNLARAAPLAAVWWVRSRSAAEQILVAIGEEQPATVEEAIAAVAAAAARLGVTLNEHAAVMARAKAAVAKLNGKLTSAQANGDLRFFKGLPRVSARLSATRRARDALWHRVGPLAQAPRRSGCGRAGVGCSGGGV